VADREDYLSFERALRELQLNEEQLKRLVSEGEISAIRGEHNTMRFRKEEIDRLKQDTGKTVQYSEESSDTLTDDLLFDESDDLDVEDEGMATAQISSEDTFVGAPAEAPSRSSSKKTPVPPRAQARGAKNRAGTKTPSGTQSIRRTTGRSTRMRAATESRSESGIGMGTVALLVVMALVGLYVLPVLADIASGHVSGPTQGIASFCGEKFGNLPAKLRKREALVAGREMLARTSSACGRCLVAGEAA